MGENGRNVSSVLLSDMPFPENRRSFIRRNQENSRSILFYGLAFSALFFLLSIVSPGFIHFLNNRAYDFLVKVAPPTKPSPIPTIIDIDERSLREFGQWPWPRHRIATLIDKVRELGALSIGLDILFAEDDRTSLHMVRRELRHEFGFDLQWSGAPQGLYDNDQNFADALSRSPAVLGYQLLFDEDSPRPDGCLLHPVSIHRIGTPEKGEEESPFLQARGAACNLRLLSSAAQGSGFFNIAPDSDGILRRVPLIIELAGRFYPNLALATLMRALKTNEAVLKMNGSGDSLVLNQIEIPLTSKGNMLIRFRGRSKTFEYISAADILLDRVPKDKIHGKILLVGTSASGMKELKTTPLDPIFQGVEVHATIIDNILQKDFLSRPKWAAGLEFTFILGFGVLSAFILARTGAGLSFLLLGALALGVLLASILAFFGGAIFISPVPALLVLGGNFSLLSFLKFWREEQIAKERTRELVMVQEATIESMSSLVETRDPETGGHIKRTQNYIRILAESLKKRPTFRAFLDDESIEILCKSAPLHDIGKVGVSDRILLKPGKLTEQEFEEMKKHTVYGRDALLSAEKKLGTISFLGCAREIAYSHHEKWNGTGYPEGLMGKRIPLAGRLMALADCYDALTSPRVYKSPMPHEEAVQIIIQENGSHFDPEIVAAFMDAKDAFQEIALRYADPVDRGGYHAICKMGTGQ